ncbi:MAG: DUF4403 family protein [Novosphingobium sp.]|nr:DUF4403 family protein [Novosphingobium sp.]
MICAFLSACERKVDYPVPPQVTTPPEFPAQNSTLAVPISLSLDDLQRRLEQTTPKQLWSIDERRKNCVPAQRVKIFGERLKVTPDVPCRIVGQVTRGKLKMTGSGNKLTITMPVNASISARDVGGVIKQETATGSANVRADVRLGMDRNWKPRATVQISYGWREPPGIDILGQRIRFVQRADKELAKVVAGLERDLQAEVARQKVRPIVAGAWKLGFTVIELNRENPPAYMRVTPTGISVTGYNVRGRQVNLDVAADAVTETFVGERPKTPEAVPLPPQMTSASNRGLRFFIPVVADYAQLEPVVLRALKRLAEKGIRIRDVGRVDAEFEKVTIYATKNGRLAVGIEAKVEPIETKFGTSLGKANGIVWLTGTPVHEPDSEVVRFRDLDIYGGADKLAADLLLQLVMSPEIKAEIASGLSEDFSKDYDRVIASAKKAVASRREGDFRIAVTVDNVEHGLVQVTGAGLFLPVTVTGKGRIEYDPR